MRIKTLSLAFLLGTILSNAQGIVTQIRDDAGSSGVGVLSGFYQTYNPINFPSGATDWWHLLDVRHTEPTNNFAMQFSGSFFDQNLYFRKTANDAANPWSKIIMENPDGKTVIGLDYGSQGDRFTINGNHVTSTFLLFAKNNPNPNAYLTLWASEPLSTYTGVGIGNNIRNYDGASAFPRINTATGGSYIRLLDNQINFGIVSNTGVGKIPLILHPTGNATLDGKFEAKEVKVTATPTADFVFDDEYNLPKLEAVEQFIKENKHLPEIASAKVMEQEGVNIGEFQIKLLQKIEELTLYTIEQNKKIEQLQKEISELKSK